MEGSVVALTFNLDVDKVDIAKRMFRDAADDTYVVSRWCFLQGMPHEACWNGLHAIEKYLKAALLCNGESSQGYSHNIVKLFADVRKIAVDLIPQDFNKPEHISLERWEQESVDAFVSRLFELGEPNSRYRTFSTLVRNHDLHKLDQLAFWCRRLATRLSSSIRPALGGKNAPQTIREWLKAGPSAQPVDFPNPMRRRLSRQFGYADAASFENWPFTSNADSVGADGGGLIFQASALTQIFFSSNNSFISLPKQRRDHYRALRDWVLGHIVLDREDKKLLLNFETEWENRYQTARKAQTTAEE